MPTPFLTPEVVKSEVVYRGFFDLRIDHILSRKGEPHTYEILSTAPEAVVILAETTEGKLVINREYRHPTKEWLLGCPGGRVDPEETPLIAAERELLEETGYGAKEWISLLTVYPFPAVCAQKLHLFLAKGAVFLKEPTHEDLELIQVELKTPEEIWRALSSNEPVDGILCTALYLLSQKHRSF